MSTPRLRDGRVSGRAWEDRFSVRSILRRGGRIIGQSGLVPFQGMAGEKLGESWGPRYIILLFEGLGIPKGKSLIRTSRVPRATQTRWLRIFPVAYSP